MIIHPVKIPYQYVVEMICDWIGAGKTYLGDKWNNKQPIEYFEKCRPTRIFHPETEKLILLFLRGIAASGLNDFYKKARCKELKRVYENS